MTNYLAKTKEKLNFLKDHYDYGFQEIADAIGTAYSTTHNYFEDPKKKIPMPILYKLADFFHVPIEDLDERYKEHGEMIRNINKNKNTAKSKSVGIDKRKKE